MESDENPGYRANVTANPSFTFSGRTIDARRITRDLLAGTLHELGGVEANVATGYHAVEFLPWGQEKPTLKPAPLAARRAEQGPTRGFRGAALAPTAVLRHVGGKPFEEENRLGDAT